MYRNTGVEICKKQKNMILFYQSEPEPLALLDLERLPRLDLLDALRLLEPLEPAGDPDPERDLLLDFDPDLDLDLLASGEPGNQCILKFISHNMYINKTKGTLVHERG